MSSADETVASPGLRRGTEMLVPGCRAEPRREGFRKRMWVRKDKIGRK